MIELISHSAINKKINIGLQIRRLNLHSLERLEEMYFSEKNKAQKLYFKIEKLYDVNKLNFAFDFHLGGGYIERCQFINSKPHKDMIIEAIILFYRTKLLIENYLLQLEEIQAKI